MKRKGFYLSVLLLVVMATLLIGCENGNGASNGQGASGSLGEGKKQENDSQTQNTTAEGLGPVSGEASHAAQLSLPENILESYYAGRDDSAYEYFQHSSIQRFLAMWVEEETKDITNPEWYLESFTKIRILDHDFVESKQDESLYCCTFSDGSGRYGYIIIKYNEEDPSISNYGVVETTPYLYDLSANQEEISAGLMKTDIDLSTATASRVCCFDREKKRADQIICFTDGKGDQYICYFGDNSFEIEKRQAD